MKQLVNNVDQLQVTTLDKISLCNILAAEIDKTKFVFTINKYGELALVNGEIGWNRYQSLITTIYDLLKDSRVKIFVFDSLVELADWIKK